MKKYKFELEDDIAQIFDSMLKETKCTLSEAVSNLLITTLGESAGNIEFYADSNRGGVAAFMLRDDNGELLSGNALFERAKLMQKSKLTEIETLKKLAGNNAFKNLLPSGSA